MNPKLYINIIISLVLVYAWVLYGFFDYFAYERGGMFDGIGIFGYFMNTILYMFGFALLLILLRMTLFTKEKRKYLRYHVVYIFAAIFNVNLFIIWLIALCLKLIELQQGYILPLIVSCGLTSLFIFVDIFKRDITGNASNLQT